MAHAVAAGALDTVAAAALGGVSLDDVAAPSAAAELAGAPPAEDMAERLEGENINTLGEGGSKAGGGNINKLCATAIISTNCAKPA